MDGVHDLGGKQGFGKVNFAPGTEIYHHAWELKANALSGALVAAGVFNMDEYRHAIERMEPRHYLTAGYYERQFTGLVTLLVEKGIVSREELERIAGGAIPVSLPSAPGRPNAMIVRSAVAMRCRLPRSTARRAMRLPGLRGPAVRAAHGRGDRGLEHVAAGAGVQRGVLAAVRRWAARHPGSGSASRRRRAPAPGPT